MVVFEAALKADDDGRLSETWFWLELFVNDTIAGIGGAAEEEEAASADTTETEGGNRLGETWSWIELLVDGVTAGIGRGR